MDAPDPRPLVPVLVGPTAVGKTAVAAALGHLLPITVVSADARQLYRGLDIGTAKPDAALQFVSHGEYPRDAKLDVSELAAYTSVTSLILNLNEVVTKE